MIVVERVARRAVSRLSGVVWEQLSGAAVYVLHDAVFAQGISDGGA